MPKEKSLIEIALFDVDGVLTDGMVYIDSNGNESKRIFFEDIDAIFALKRKKIKIGFITGENTSFTEYVKTRFSPDFFASGCKDKLGYFKEVEKNLKLNRSRICYVGDSEKDIPLLKYVKFSFVPSDADKDVKKASRFVADAGRGKGVIKEVANFIINA